MIIIAPPAIKPSVKTMYEYSPPDSRAGSSNEKNDDATIMPDATDTISANADLPTFLKKKMSEAPAAVIAQVKVHAISACCQPLN